MLIVMLVMGIAWDRRMERQVREMSEKLVEAEWKNVHGWVKLAMRYSDNKLNFYRSEQRQFILSKLEEVDLIKRKNTTINDEGEKYSQ